MLQDLTNNALFAITSANAKAIGIIPGDFPGIDAVITFNSSVSFDFDPSNGITPGTTDFIGVATHEIGHALGFVSGVDTVDTFSFFSIDADLSDGDDVLLETGSFNGTGQQASHFLDGFPSLGILDPTAAAGELLLISDNDILVFDVIGYDLAFILGDVNQDGVVDFSDIPDFISFLRFGGFLEEADTNRDTVVNFLDILPFINLLQNQ